MAEPLADQVLRRTSEQQANVCQHSIVLAEPDGEVTILKEAA